MSGLRSLHVFAALHTVVLSFAEKNEVRATAAIDATYPLVIPDRWLHVGESQIWLWDLNKDDAPQVCVAHGKSGQDSHGD